MRLCLIVVRVDALQFAALLDLFLDELQGSHPIAHQTEKVELLPGVTAYHRDIATSGARYDVN